MPVRVMVYPDHMVISFHGGAVDFGLWIEESEDAWDIHSYPMPAADKNMVSLTLKKDPKTGALNGRVYGVQPFSSETNRSLK